MRIITGDETGLVKSVVFPPKVEEPKRRSKKVKQDQEGEDEKKKNEPTMILNKFGVIDKNEGVQKLCWGELNGKRHIVVARKSGKIQYLDVETGHIEREYRDENVNKESHFVGLHATEKYLITCTTSGHLSYTLLSSYNPKDTNNKTTCISSTLGPDLYVMRVHPARPHLFATGGKENDLKVYDANLLMKEKEEEKKKALVFQAKNVKNDMLDLRVKVWIHDLHFLNEEGTRIVTATHYHQVRVYETKKQRRPVSDFDVGKNPLLTLHIGVDFDHVIYTDTMSTVATVDLRRGTVGSHYKGFTGSVSDVFVTPQPSFNDDDDNKKMTKPFLTSVSLDRFLRVHEMSTQFRRIEQKVYLKQRMTAVLVDETFEFPKDEGKEQEDQEENEMWDAMETVADSDKSKSKRKRA
ncbi:WD40-repeat-containing domain protein [Phascolomyces articulosus]|uniref:Ribosome biogenesis protein NSA1 n=1 Tax=Phascolomyces articulosus TaxID=60185 RepID=A0AAD5K7W9_9FUNG|nr:WD40-repeat-containing domain protein [Phascolomyces articulosus]